MIAWPYNYDLIAWFALAVGSTAWVDLIVEYGAGYSFGIFILRSLFVKKMAVGGVSLNDGARYQTDTVNVSDRRSATTLFGPRGNRQWLVHCHIPHHTANNKVEEKGSGGLMLVLDVH